MENKTTLPHPKDGNHYEYLRFDTLKERFFTTPLRKNELVWVLRSKGRRSKAVREPSSDGATTAEEPIHKSKVDSISTATAGINHRSQRLELFLRAQVIEDEKVEQVEKDCCMNHDPTPTSCSSIGSSRIAIRYPKGSAYSVSRTHLIRVLDKQYDRIILVYPETPLYRRACIVHTLPDETFLEIGSGLGLNVERVYEKATRSVFGIDKSKYCIGLAQERFPGLTLLEWDILAHPENLPDGLQCVNIDILAVDINGSRELEAVLQCLEIALNLWRPRLVIVKSRTLYQRLAVNSE